MQQQCFPHGASETDAIFVYTRECLVTVDLDNHNGDLKVVLNGWIERPKQNIPMAYSSKPMVRTAWQSSKPIVNTLWDLRHRHGEKILIEWIVNRK